jgi:excisionase family DNA binding protein
MPPVTPREPVQDLSPLPPPLFTMETLAEYLGLSVETLRNWRAGAVKQGPRAVKIGTAVRFRPQEVAAWLDAQVEDRGIGPTEPAEPGGR